MTLEQEERFHLDQLRNEFNGARKDYDVLLELEEEKNSSYQLFDIQD